MVFPSHGVGGEGYPVLVLAGGRGILCPGPGWGGGLGYPVLVLAREWGQGWGYPVLVLVGGGRAGLPCPGPGQGVGLGIPCPGPGWGSLLLPLGPVSRVPLPPVD